MEVEKESTRANTNVRPINLTNKDVTLFQLEFAMPLYDVVSDEVAERASHKRVGRKVILSCHSRCCHGGCHAVCTEPYQRMGFVLISYDCSQSPDHGCMTRRERLPAIPKGVTASFLVWTLSIG